MLKVGNLSGFPAVKEFWKSVKNWQDDRHEFGVLLFWDTVYYQIGRSQKAVISYEVTSKEIKLQLSDNCRRSPS